MTAAQPAIHTGPWASVTARRLLEEAVAQKASDLHITVGVPPVLRIDGEIITMP